MSEWIGVKEILPPQDGTPFIGYDPNADEPGKIYVLIYVPEKIYPPGEFFRLSHQSYYQEASGEGYFKWNPTHWMPLPEPPND
jgi:hypothetical protein